MAEEARKLVRAVAGQARAVASSVALQYHHVADTAGEIAGGNFPLGDDWDFAIATWNFAHTGHFKFTHFTAVSLRAQVVGFEQNLQAFLADCKARTSCAYGRAGDPASKLNAAMTRLDTTPLKVGGRQLTRSLAMTGLLVTLYDQSLWRFLDQGLTALDSGDGRTLLLLADLYNKRKADGTYANLFNGAYQATYCLDFQVPADVAAYDQLGPSFANASPLFGPWSQYSNLQCTYWPVKPKNPTGPLPIKGAPPILLVGGTNDPATPYAEAQAVSRLIEGSILLTRTGNGHTSYDSSPCAHAAEDAYLIDLTLPAAGTVCPS